MSEAITPWLHILAITVWIGPQFFLFIAAIPALRTVEDVETRTRVMRTVVTRFGWMAWAAMGVIILTGISNLFQTGEDAPFDLDGFDYRWARIFAEKMVFVALAIGLTAIHTFYVGPRQLQIAEQMNADPAEVRNLRRLSIAISAAALLASIAALYMGAVLANHEYSFQPD
jgi:uncharacterized membrane protein